MVMQLHGRATLTNISVMNDLMRLRKYSDIMSNCFVSNVVGVGNLVILRIGIDAEVEFTPSSTEGRRVESTPLSCQSC